MAINDHNSSEYRDRLAIEALRLIQAASGDEAAGAAAYRAAWNATRRFGGGPGLDPIHIAQYLASMIAQAVHVLPFEAREVIERQIEEIRLIAAAEIPDLDTDSSSGT